MIIFHEGLPGSGKSYEACINQIIPALKKGRVVYAYIEGINRAKFAEVTGLSLDTVIELLHPLKKEQVKDVQNHVADNSLVLLDELQDFFPTGKATLDPGITEFVTQHRHRGIDIVCMGQDHRDCHMLWKRRIDTLIQFTKRDAIGQPKSYTWVTNKQKAGKFEKLRSGKGSYDSKYFGLYASHSEGVESIDAHEDDRTNIFKSSMFTFWLPAFGAVLLVAVWYSWGFFHKSDHANNIASQPVKVSAAPVAPTAAPLTQTKLPEQAKQIKEQVPVEVAKQYSSFVEKCLEEYRPRLSGLAVSTDGAKVIAKIDFYDNGNRVKETFGVKQMQAFGYSVQVKEFGVLIEKNGKQYPVTAWPLDIERNATKEQMPNLGHPV